uniref:Uncharacterized protein n=1 Tax=Triticum urartu TaxID=4572 RepID=A0A8R7QNX1_TRIUA
MARVKQSSDHDRNTMVNSSKDFRFNKPRKRSPKKSPSKCLYPRRHEFVLPNLIKKSNDLRMNLFRSLSSW